MSSKADEAANLSVFHAPRQAESEQTNSALALGVAINRDCEVAAAGGYLVQVSGMVKLAVSAWQVHVYGAGFYPGLAVVAHTKGLQLELAQPAMLVAGWPKRPLHVSSPCAFCTLLS